MDFVRCGAGNGIPKGLTPRQREVLQLIAEGHSTKRIALLLKISVKTVETHRMLFTDRLHIHDTAGLVRYAIKAGARGRPWEFLRHEEIYQSDERKMRRAQPCGRALAHRLDEFPVGYSLASCSPAELASASPTGLIVNNGPVESNNSFRRAEAVS